MTPEQFCYWLQGFGELSPEPPTPEQWKSINEHLGLVFKKVTPKAPGQIQFGIGQPTDQAEIRRMIERGQTVVTC